MITPQLLSSKIILVILAILSLDIYSAEKLCSKEFDVLIRSKKSFNFEKKELQNFNCKDRFEGKDFKIVEGTSEEAISFNADPELLKRASNVYYHLTQAKNYWVESLQSNYVKNMDQLTIRINITNSYSRTRHFKNTDQEENYNNAWSVPDGETPRFIKDKSSWGKEIWFSPRKTVESRKEVESTGKNPVYQSLEIIQEPIIESTKNNLLYQGLSYVAYDSVRNSQYINSAITKVGIMAILLGASEVTKHMDKVFINKFYYVDTAMVPEIIYHEFAHVALSDTMKTVHSVPVIEGMADYFASRIQTDKILYKKLEGYSINRTKKIYNKSLYHPYLEQGWNAESDFVLSLLWKARTNFDKANAKRAQKKQEHLVDFDQLVLQTHLYLTETSDIMNDLTQSLLDACNEKCSSKRFGHDVLHKSFEEKGLN